LSLKSELEKLKEMLSLKETENREFKHENNQMNILKKELEEHKKNSAARTAEVQKQLNSAYEEAKELRLKQKELKKESEEKENEIRDLNQALELAQARMERDTSIHCAEVEKLAAALRASNEALLKERTLASSLRTELETSTTSNRKLTDKNTSLGTEVSSLKSRLQEVELIVEKRVATSNTTLRMYSQQISTVKKSPPVRDDVRLCLTKTIDGIISIVADYKNSLLAQK
jgi:chromosome segregation ATPase